MVEKASRLPSVYIYSARNFFVCKQQRRRSASAPAQFYQLSLESMIAKPAKNKIPIRHACADPDNSNGGGGGGGGEVRTSFSSRKQMATYDFHGEVRTPCPLCLRPYQSFKQFGFTFYFLFFAGPGQFTWERSGSVVECLTRDWRAAGSSLTGVPALWSLSKTHLS